MMTDKERAAWLADKICNGGDYAKEAAALLQCWPDSPAPQALPLAPSEAVEAGDRVLLEVIRRGQIEEGLDPTCGYIQALDRAIARVATSPQATLPASEAAQGRYSFVCGGGCGVCKVKLMPFEYERTETLAGDLLGSKCRPQVVSACCGADVHAYDNQTDGWGELVDVKVANNAEHPASIEREIGRWEPDEPTGFRWATGIFRGSFPAGTPIYVSCAHPQADAAEPESGIEIAARFVEKRLLDYDAEHGMTDPATGTREYPGDGDEYVGELQEIADGIRAIAAKKEGQP